MSNLMLIRSVLRFAFAGIQVLLVMAIIYNLPNVAAVIPNLWWSLLIVSGLCCATVLILQFLLEAIEQALTQRLR